MGTGSKATVESGTAKNSPSILESLIVIKENRRKIETPEMGLTISKCGYCFNEIGSIEFHCVQTV